MYSKIVTALLVLFIAATGFLYRQQLDMKKELEAIKTSAQSKQEVAPPPVPPSEATPASPFDNSNKDPLSSENTPTPEHSPIPGHPEKNTSIKFDKMVHDFGRLTEGDKVKTTFRFKNTGSSPLVIFDVETSCGCTVPSWPRQPIPPGESSEIEVQFDSHNKMGETSKGVMVKANTDPFLTTLTIKSTVIPKDK